MDSFEEKLSAVYGEQVKIWGPYTCSDGRRRVDVKTSGNPNGTTHLLAKIVLEIKLGRKLLPGETVDHIDEDKTNDQSDNLQPLSLRNNALKSTLYRHGPIGVCVGCGVGFELSRHQTSVRARSKPGPYCSKSCASQKVNRSAANSLERGVPEYKRLSEI